MKTKPTKILLIILLFVGYSSISMAQKETIIVQFGYDSAGNRISRDIIYVQEHHNKSEKDKESKLFTLGDVIIEISPNPNGGKFNVSVSDCDSQNNTQLTVFDLHGKEIYSQCKIKERNLIDISNHPNGTYLLQITSGQERKIWKIIKY